MTPARYAGAAGSRQWVVDGLVAGAVAGVVSGLPSTAAAVRQGTGLLTATRAAGTLLGRPTVVRGAVAHVVLSLGWGVVLSGLRPRRKSAGDGARPTERPTRQPAGRAGSPADLVAGAVAGAAAGAAIAILDLAVVGRRFPAIRGLPPVPQWLDHLAFGAVVGVVLARRSQQ